MFPAPGPFATFAGPGALQLLRFLQRNVRFKLPNMPLERPWPCNINVPGPCNALALPLQRPWALQQPLVPVQRHKSCPQTDPGACSTSQILPPSDPGTCSTSQILPPSDPRTCSTSQILPGTILVPVPRHKSYPRTILCLFHVIIQDHVVDRRPRND